ncbi:MAG: rod-binding protein [Clostridiaceae bacterium]|nr:rod-binding protein [Clostridiaceae bacterium]
MKINDALIHLNNEKTIKQKNIDDSKKLKAACQEFEAIFLNMMLKQMRSTIPDGGLTEKSYARDIYESLQDEEMSKEMSKTGGIGLAQQLYKQLSKP